ncbi:magnesium transporter MgtE N-terminal domain-containing protein [Wolbachia endosymbiont (group A) of Pogonocherus hispidulus]|uniref:magnesium transporter MgtE N-terminal domain-containing protein n=1 Tax=Wolbachia endosymbiont (group A) of Pogonocherus hispidulus TaxID=3066136 RepID=UPI00397B0634
MNLLVTPMSGKKHVFKMVPGKELSKELGSNTYWVNFDHLKFVRKVELTPLSKEDGVLELPIRFCSGPLWGAGLYCIGEKGNTLTYKVSRNDPDYSKNSHAFVYHGNTLARLSVKSEFVYNGITNALKNTVGSEQLKYQYVTWEESDTGDNKYYFSDREGNIIDSPHNRVLQDMILYDEKKAIKNILSSISENTVVSSTFPKVFIQGLTDDQLKTLANTLSNEQLQKIIPELSSNQLKTLANTFSNEQLQKIVPKLSSNQLQALAENLTDEQLQTLVDHLTNHQLQTLAQELNPEKLQIIVPILNDAQLEALVRDLNPEQVKEILPHLKVDQFKALIKTLNDEQFTVLAKDLAEHHLTILSKELEGDQLKALVNSLQEDQLKDLVNKLDHGKLEAIAQDLTDSNRIQIIIKSLANNPEKLQAFARNMSNEQFKELLDNVGAEELKDIIHKLPYEKVTAVIGDLGNQDQSKAIIDALKGKLDEQSKQNKEMIEMLKQIKDDMPEIGQAPDFTIVDINNDSLLFV